MSNHNSGPVYGSLTQQDGYGNSIYNGTPSPPREAPGPATGPGGGPRHALYSFADTVGYSHFSARLQKLSQHDLVDIVRRGVAEAGVEPGEVVTQDQGDAQLLAFPRDTDTAKVLAVLPRFIDEELKVRNQDMAQHAQLRVRLAFAMGASVPGAAGLVGDAPVAVARLANSDVFRTALRVATRARCGVLIDDYLHTQLVRQRFRADIDPEDYIPVRVQQPDKGFDARAWLKLFGYSGPEIRSLLT